MVNEKLTGKDAVKSDLGVILIAVPHLSAGTEENLQKL
jgi:hypothetical protein